MTTRRDLPSDVLTEIAIDFTRPVYLVRMEFPAGESYLSSGPQITFDGNTYNEGQVSVGSFVWTPDGSQSGTLTLSNENNAASALILAGSINDIVVNIYKTYLIAAGGNTTPQLYIKGSLDGSDIGASRSKVNVLSTTAQTSFIPSRYYTIAEGFNWLPIDGEVVTWGGDSFVLTTPRN